MLGYVDIDGDPNQPGHEECMIRDPETGHQLLFIEVPDAKSVKNRLHLDLRPRVGDPRRGARDPARPTAPPMVADHRGKYGPGTGWVVLADPEGNEFCILRSEAEIEVDHQTTATRRELNGRRGTTVRWPARLTTKARSAWPVRATRRAGSARVGQSEAALFARRSPPEGRSFR